MRIAPIATQPGVPIRPDSFPRWVLLAAGSMLLLSLASVALVRITGNGPDQRAAAGTVERHLRFEDRPDGGIAVFDAGSGAPLATIQGEQGFVRGTLRALARDRKARGVGAEQPFALIQRPDGGLTLFDPVSRHRVDLDAFGPDNAAHFGRLLPGAVPRPPAGQGVPAAERPQAVPAQPKPDPQPSLVARSTP